MADEIKTLLERWAKAEPERCKGHQFGEKFYLEVGNCVFQPDLSPFSVLVRGHRFEGEEAEMWLQFAVQQAIIQRDWSFDLSFGSLRYQTWLQAEWGNPSYSRVQKTGAVAMLVAYIQALEAK